MITSSLSKKMADKNNAIITISTIATIGILAVMSLTLISQKGFNQKQIEFNERVLALSEISAVPQAFAVLDSFRDPKLPMSHNIYYSVKNTGNMPALAVRAGTRLVKEKRNPLEQEIDMSAVQTDIFPNEIKSFATYHPFEHSKDDTLYFHVRVDYQDMLDYKYCYRATYYVFIRPDTLAEGLKVGFAMENSKFIRLGQSNHLLTGTSGVSAQSDSTTISAAKGGKKMIFFGTLVGAFIGVLGAFGVQWLFMRKGVKARREEEKKRKKYILQILKGEIQHNVDLLNQIKKEYQKPFYIGYYNLDTTTKQAVWGELVNTGEDEQFVRNLSLTYYEYKHMNRKLDFQFSSAVQAVMNANVAQLRNNVVTGIVSHVDSILSGSKDRLGEIEKKLNTL